MKTVKVKISELRSPEKNVRKHNEKQIKEFCRSLKMFGQIRPVVIDEENVVYCGNGLLEAARSLGWEEIEVLKMGDLDEPGDVGAGEVVAGHAVFRGGVVGVAVDFDHDAVQAAVHFLGRPVEVLGVLGHFEAGRRDAARVGRLGGAEQDLGAEERLDGFA